MNKYLVQKDANIHPFLADLLLLIGLFLLCASLASMLAVFSVGLYYGVLDSVKIAQFLQFDSLSRHPDGWYVLLYMQFVSSIGSLVVSSLVYLRFSKPTMRLNTNALLPKDFGKVLVVVLAMMPFTAWIALWNMGIDLPSALDAFEKWAKAKEFQIKQFTDFLIHFLSIWHFLLGVLVVAVLPAIGEELWFRGLLQNILLRRFNAHLAIWLAGALFSAIHFQFYGVLFGYLYFWSKNIWLPIFAHFLNNSITLLFVYLYQKQVLDYDLYQPKNVPLYVVAFGLILVGTALYSIYKASRKPIQL
jgi:uncharacterized protein